MDERKRRRAVGVLSVLVVCNLILIWGHSMLPPGSSTQESSFIASLFAKWFPNIDFELLEYIIRKCAHFAEFTCLGLLSVSLIWNIAYCDIRRAWSLTAIPFFGCLFAASTDEMIQVFSGRGNSVYDVMLDFAGSLTGIGIFFAFVLIRDAAKRKRDPSPVQDAVGDEDKNKDGMTE